MYPHDAHDYDVLKKTIYAEARGEPEEGQIAVAHVILNRARANKPYFNGSRIADVCKMEGQFEGWKGKSDIPIHEAEALRRIDEFLGKVLDGSIPDPTGGCYHYNNPDKEGYPEWTKNCQRAMKIKNHQFYRCPLW